jgi:hypothetical protein
MKWTQNLREESMSVSLGLTARFTDAARNARWEMLDAPLPRSVQAIVAPLPCAS